MEKTSLAALQKIIERKAEKRLERDLLLIYTVIADSPVFGSATTNIPNYPKIKFPDANNGGADSETWPYWLFRFEKNTYGGYNSSQYMDKVKTALLPKYIEEETRLFLETVDQLNLNYKELMDEGEEQPEE